MRSISIQSRRENLCCPTPRRINKDPAMGGGTQTGSLLKARRGMLTAASLFLAQGFNGVEGGGFAGG